MDAAEGEFVPQVVLLRCMLRIMFYSAAGETRVSTDESM